MRWWVDGEKGREATRAFIGSGCARVARVRGRVRNAGRQECASEDPPKSWLHFNLGNRHENAVRRRGANRVVGLATPRRTAPFGGGAHRRRESAPPVSVYLRALRSRYCRTKSPRTASRDATDRVATPLTDPASNPRRPSDRALGQRLRGSPVHSASTTLERSVSPSNDDSDDA